MGSYVLYSALFWAMVAIRFFALAAVFGYGIYRADERRRPTVLLSAGLMLGSLVFGAVMGPTSLRVGLAAGQLMEFVSMALSVASIAVLVVALVRPDVSLIGALRYPEPQGPQPYGGPGGYGQPGHGQPGYGQPGQPGNGQPGQPGNGQPG